MKKIVALVVLALVCASSAAFAKEDKTPPKPSESDQKVKPPVCEWVCVSYNKDGTCATQAYQCN